MELLEIQPSRIQGEVTIPPSKSFAHRALICSALAGKGEIHNFVMSKDMEATLNFLTAIGMEHRLDGNTLLINRSKNIPNVAMINCIESGSTLRFIIPIMAALGISTTFVGQGRLPERPLKIYTDILPQMGVSCTGAGLPLEIDGKLKSGDFTVAGNISSQFITGLLLALPLLDGDSRIILNTPLESGDYINITIEVMAYFGVQVERTEYGWLVNGGQSYEYKPYTVEGDWSQAAFFLTMGAFSESGIKIKGLNINSIQGDILALDIYKKMGVDITENEEYILARKSQLKGINVDVKNIPDTAPALGLCLSLASGDSLIYGGERLRIKESDRITAVVSVINNLGGSGEETADGMKIQGCDTLKSKSKIDGFNDHRIVMAVASVAERISGAVYVTDPMSINKSYPNFLEDFNKLGGVANVINVGE